MTTYAEIKRIFLKCDEERRHVLALAHIDQMTFETEDERNLKDVKISELYEIEENDSNDESTLAFSLDNLNYITQLSSFTRRDNVIVLKLKDEYKYMKQCFGLIRFIMMTSLALKYNYDRKLTSEILMNEVIPGIPFVPDKDVIDVSRLKNMYA